VPPTTLEAYYQRKLAEGKSPKEALRLLNGGCRMRSTGAWSSISGKPEAAAPTRPC